MPQSWYTHLYDTYYDFSESVAPPNGVDDALYNDTIRVATEWYNVFGSFVVAELAVDKIAELGTRGTGQPWFLYVAFQNIHWPVRRWRLVFCSVGGVRGGRRGRHVQAGRQMGERV
jgi:hypothetical protein